MWYDVPGFEEVQVTECGRVRTVDRRIWIETSTRCYWQNCKGKELTPIINDGYPKVMLRNRNPAAAKQRPYGVHVLVCRAFHGKPPPDKPLALHKDDDRSNPHKDNLYWGSQADNGKDKAKNRKMPSGSAHHFAKLTDEDVAAIRAAYKPKCRTNGAIALAKRYGVHRTSIENIVRGTTWTAAPG